MNFTGTKVIHAIWTDSNLIVPFPEKNNFKFLSNNQIISDYLRPMQFWTLFMYVFCSFALKSFNLFCGYKTGFIDNGFLKQKTKTAELSFCQLSFHTGFLFSTHDSQNLF